MVVKKPQIAIFGDIYVRDNDMMNQNLTNFIEDHGGEVVIMPFSEITKMIVNPYIERSIKSGTYTEAITAKAMITFIASLEKIYYKYFNEILNETPIDWNFNFKKVLRKFNLKTGHTGESVDNLLIIYGLNHNYPGIRLLVQTIPAFCSAGLVTEAMIPHIEKLTGIPVVTLTYDGTNKNQNEKIVPYMKYYK